MIHVRCRPPPDFLRASELADEAGWVDVDQNTLRHKRFANVWGLGDAMNAPMPRPPRRPQAGTPPWPTTCWRTWTPGAPA